MMVFVYLKRVFAVAILISGIATVAFADDAPVYEVDNYPPPFDSQQPDNSGAMVTDSEVVGMPPPPQASYTPPPPQTYAPPPVAHASPPPQQEFYTPPPVPTRSLSTGERLAKVEQQINNLQQANSSAKSEELQKEVQSLRGQVEELTHQLQQAQNQQRSMYADLDQRLTGFTTAKSAKAKEDNEVIASQPRETIPIKSATKLAANKPPANTANTTKAVSANTAVASQEQLNPAEEQQIYQAAYDLIKSKKYNDAITMLQKMLKKYPSGQSAANAHYWLGELYGLLNKSDQSAAEFSKVISDYPTSPKVSDASLKLGLIYVGQFKWVEAKTTFKKVIKLYPGTASARVATEQLKQIKQAGH